MKLSHQSVHYGPGRKTGEHCGICVHYQAPHCEIVQDPIRPLGWCERYKAMAKLDAAKRNALPAKDFAEPGERKFPIEDKSHARNALSRASAKGPAVEAKVKAKVHKKFPSIGHKRGAPKYPSIAKDYVS